MSHKEIGLNIYIDSAWQKQKQKQYDTALMWYHKAFEPMKTIFDQMQLEADPLSWFTNLPRYHKISYEKLFAFVFNCGLAEFEVQNYETSLYYFDVCKKLDVLNCMPFIYSAFALFLQEKQKEAFQQISQSVSQLQNSLNNEVTLSELYCICALLHHRKNEMQVAIEYCDRALSLHPTSIIALIIKADSIKFRSASKKQEEIDVYHQILSIDSQNAIRFVGKGFLAVDNLGWLIRFRDLFFFYSQSYKSVNMDLLEQTYSKKSDEELYNSFVYFGNIVFANQEKKSQIEHLQQRTVTPTELVTTKFSPKTNKTIHRDYDKPWLQNAKKPKARAKLKPSEEVKNVARVKRSYAKPWKRSKLTAENSANSTAKIEFAMNAPSTSKMSLYKLSDSTTENAPTITITSSVNPNTMMKPKDTPFVSIINGKAIRFDTLIQQLREKSPIITSSEMNKKQAEKRVALLKTSGSTLFEKEVRRSPIPTPPPTMKKNTPKKPTLVPNQVQLNSSIIPGSVEEVMNFEKSTLTTAKNIVVTNSKIPYSLPLLVS